MGKKFLSAVLSAALLVSVVPTAILGASAEETADYGLAGKTSEGVILHAFNWSYSTIKENLPSIAEAGYTTVQTSPVQQPKDFCASQDTKGQWWKLYQPLSFSVAEESWLGTKEELTELCTEAEKYGIKIICDIVSNHMANDKEGNALTYYADIEKYEPEIYNNTDKYFHQLKSLVDDVKVEHTVQGTLDGLPDLNTGDEYVQSRVISLLEECIDCGVDGFRFDAAKHIETPEDGDYASNFWPNVVNTATEYAQSKGVDLFCYGEVLNTPGNDRDIKAYTKYLNITDNKAGDATLYCVVNKMPEKLVKSQNYTYDDDHSNYVLWAESHDTYMGNSGSAISNTANVSNEDIAKAWAVIASRSDSQSLFLARPGLLMSQAGDSSWKSTAVSEINKFHNKFIGTSDSVYSEESVVAVQRGDSGIVLVNLGDSSDVSLTTQGMADGTYTDSITGNTFTVANGTISGSIGSTGIAVVYSGAETTPRAKFSKEDSSFKTDTMKLTIELENATSGTYSIDNSTPVEFTGSTTITIGEGVAVGSVITVTVTATDGKKTTTTTHKYTKEEGNNSGVFVYFDNAKRNYSNVFIYAYYEIVDENNEKQLIAQNGSWPGVLMDYNDEKGLYFYEMPQDLKVNEANVIFNDGNGNQTKSYKLTSDCMIYADGKFKDYNPDGVMLVYGDIDNNDKIDADDSLSILKAAVGIESYNEQQTAQADVDKDGVITATDALSVLRYSVGIEDGNVGQEFAYDGEVSDTVNPDKPDDKTDDNDVPRSGKIFYIVDKAGWLFKDGAKLWLVNNETNQALETTKETIEDDSSRYSYIDFPVGWKDVSIYRTGWDQDTNAPYNTWNIGEVPDDKNAVRISSDTTFRFINYDPEA